MRKGSKRFPNKMMADLCGKPLYRHTVDFALQLGYPYYLAHDYGKLDIPVAVNQIERSEYFAGDIHRTNEEILSWGLGADIYILLQATSPIRDLDLLKQDFTNVFFMNNNINMICAAEAIKDGYYYSGNGKPINFEQDMRDDCGCWKDIILKETGSFYIFKKHLLERVHIMDKENDEMILFLHDNYGIDIDKEEDLIKAREYLEDKNNS